MLVTGQSRHLRILVCVAVLFTVCASVWLRRSRGYSTLSYAHQTYGSLSDYLSDGNAKIPALERFHNTPTEGAFNGVCASVPDADDVLLVLKTGATEIFERIPTHLLTTLRCVPDFLIFSDMGQQLGPHRIHDALANVPATVMADNSDFDLYRDQQQCRTTQKDCVDSRMNSFNAWNLDKYKFLPILERAWHMRPGRDWYIFAEGDTYVLWANMVHWLRHESSLNPEEPIYLGSRSFIGGVPFAHGGSGYVLSGALLKHLVESHPDAVEKYSIKVAGECCGDLILAKALEEYEGVKIRQAWPMFNGEKPNTLPYGPGHWCEPILTMHHVNAEDITNIWLYEQSRGPNSVILMRDFYRDFVYQHIRSSREDWDNLSDDVCYVNPDPEAQTMAEAFERDRQPDMEITTDVEKNAWKSWEDCAKVCESEVISNPLDRQCFQYRWHKEVCCTSRSFKLGGPKSKPDFDKPKEQWMSGWNIEGINAWIEAKGSCDEPAWKVPEEP